MCDNKCDENNWYSFHFGSTFVNNNQPLPDYFGNSYNDSYVLFADLCNFTKFFSASDNINEIEHILQEYYTLARKAIHKNFGMLDKILGDGFLIVWGIHIQKENIEKYIFQCITELNEIGIATSKKWQSIIDSSISSCGMKFGLAKGKLLTIQRSENYPGIAILGSAINMASRMENMAQPGKIVCSNKAFKKLSHFSKEFKSENSDSDVKGFGLVKTHTITIGASKCC